MLGNGEKSVKQPSLNYEIFSNRHKCKYKYSGLFGNKIMASRKLSRRDRSNL